MNTEWLDLPTMADVARAQIEGWEIESNGSDEWVSWNTGWWNIHFKFRGRPARPKMKKVKMLCYLDDTTQQLVWSASEHVSGCWIRIPAEDKEICVPDDV